jgi:gamma-glutamyltranspeptidase/glutathione hydrolase
LRRPLVLGLLLAACAAPGGSGREAPRLAAGAVVTEHPLATAVGLEILEAGGNAADAAVATSLALAVVYPQAGNLGGGGFALWSGRDGSLSALDFREVAPAGADASRYLGPGGEVVSERSIAGPLAVGVPGSPAGLHELAERHGSGRLSWSDLCAPAVRLAREGFTVEAWLERTLASPSIEGRMNAAARELLYPEGRGLRAGERLVQPELARTLERLASEGPGGFYRGPVAEALLAALAEEPVPLGGAAGAGAIQAADLESYRPVWRTPLRGRFQGHELVAMPPPSSGGLVVLQTLAILDGLPLGGEVRAGKELGLRGGVTGTMAHWWIEALRASFADRAEHMGDPDFHRVPSAELLSAEWILERRAGIGARPDLEVGPWTPPPPESPQTTHLSVVDAEGNAVSLTTTLNSSFGSGILVRGAGFFLNNELDDFAIAAGVPNQFGLVGNEANAIRPGKRPLSSMSPMIVRDDRGAVVLVLGSPGGPRIITAVTQVVLRVLLLEEDLHEAVRAPRLHQQWRPRETWLEARHGGGWDEAVLLELERRGQPVELVERHLGSVQAIGVGPDGVPVAVSDPRRGGAGGVTGLGVQAPAPVPAGP